MALQQSYTYSGVATFINDLKSFCEGCGWTIDKFDIGSRIHLHKGVGHFEIWYRDANSLNIRGCTGYDDAQGSTTQPNTCPTDNYISAMNYAVGMQVQLVSAGNTVMMGFHSSALSGAPKVWNSFGTLPDANKVGQWSGGIYTVAGSLGDYEVFWITNTFWATMFVNNAWTWLVRVNTSAHVNAVCGSFNNHGLQRTVAPHCYSLTLSAPIIFLRDSINGGLYRPLGFVPNVYMTLPGASLYLYGDIITIEGVQHLLTSSNGYWFLIKMEV